MGEKHISENSSGRSALELSLLFCRLYDSISKFEAIASPEACPIALSEKIVDSLWRGLHSSLSHVLAGSLFKYPSEQ